MELYHSNSQCLWVSTTESPKNAIFNVTFLPILLVTGYFDTYDLFILFDEIFIHFNTVHTEIMAL